MLHFLSMTISNFGPYKGVQTIDFTEKNGVTIFWGDNGRGKTTLLNAFRYALFGTIQRRNGVLRSLKEMENIEGRADGIYGFSVVLRMENDGIVYELTRQYKPRKGVEEPSYEEDYEKVMFLKKGGTFLSQDQSEHELNVIMPEQVSRFFLFDGELLQEYEELLENETSTGERIKEAIEKILGVPVLTNGVIDIRECQTAYERQKATAMQKDTKTRQYGLQIETIDKSIEEHKRQLETLKSKLSEYYKAKLILTEKSEETEQVRGWMARRDAAKKEKADKEAELENVTASICAITKDAWKGMLIETITAATDALTSEIATLEQKKQNKAVADRFIKEIRSAVAEKKCPVCEQDIADEYITILQERIARSESQFSGLSKEEADRLLTLQGRLNSLRKLRAENRAREVKHFEDRRVALQIAIGSLAQEISELNERIRRYGDTSEVAGIARDLAATLSKIEITERGIRDEQAVLDKDNESRANILALINKQAVGGDLLSASRRLELCDEIFHIFEKGMAAYRDKLKKNVEKDATDLFVNLSSDKDYVGLRIHDNYGLSIVHASGELVPGRSSGFEHVVALSLIGALHKNAPLRGPIIMDSPFGRLDPTHKRNIVRYLPEMAEQSMLLAYTGEIDAQVAHEALAGHLLHEYRLIKISSMHTRIE